MYEEQAKYAALQGVGASNALNPSYISLKQRLQEEKTRIVQEGQRLDELLSLLDNNPEVERIIELMGRKFY
jgi:hypothetical protein